MLKKILVLLVFLQLPAAPAAAVTFDVGQVWSYRTRAGEEDSRIYIARVDRDFGAKPIFHIYVDGLKLKNPLMEGGVQDHLPHIPVSQESLESSVITLTQEGVIPPDISEGYVIWREAFEREEAGVFTISVQQIVQHIEAVFAKHAGQQQ